MRVIDAVSVGVPREVEIHGQRVTTSIIREPATEPVYFGPTGPAGNQTAVHTEQVYAFPSEHYAYWTRRFDLPADAWPLAFWGENLTISGLDENELPIGTILRIGAAAVLQVTSPRTPCFKLTWRLGQPVSFISTLMQSGLSGFYLRVLEPGLIAAGDAVEVEWPAADQITVGDLSRILQDESLAGPDALRRILATPGLGHQTAQMLRHRLMKLTDGIRTARDRWAGWRPFVIAAVTEEARDIRSFELVPRDGKPIADYHAGQFLPVRLPSEDGQPLYRSWSLSDYREGGSAYRITIKREPQGIASRLMHDTLGVGDTVELQAPAGRFTLDRSGILRTVLISAGIGVTPLLAMLKAHALRGPEAPPLLWIHSTRNGGSHAFAAELAAVLAQNPNFRAHVAFTEPGRGETTSAGCHQVGRIAAADLERLLAPYRCAPFGRAIDLPGSYGEFYLCGPAGFEAEMRALLTAAGVDPGMIRSEMFRRVPGARDDAAVAESRVVFARSGITATWLAASGQSLLELAEAHGIQAPFQCRAGFCQTCRASVSSGSVEHDPAPVPPPETGRALLCCATPKSGELVLEL